MESSRISCRYVFYSIEYLWLDLLRLCGVARGDQQQRGFILEQKLILGPWYLLALLKSSSYSFQISYLLFFKLILLKLSTVLPIQFFLLNDYECFYDFLQLPIAASIFLEGADIRYLECDGLSVLIKLMNDYSHGEKSFLHAIFALILFILYNINPAYITIGFGHSCSHIL